MVFKSVLTINNYILFYKICKLRSLCLDRRWLMVAEVLAGIALVSSAVKGIKSTIDTAKDIRDIAGSLEDLLDGAEQVEKRNKLAQHKKGKAGQWQKFLKLKFQNVEDTGDGTSIQEVAAEVIEKKETEKQIRAMQILINKKFGPTTWADILIMRQQRIEELKKRKEKEKELEEERLIKKQALHKKILKETMNFMILAIIGGGIVYILMYIMGKV